MRNIKENFLQLEDAIIILRIFFFFLYLKEKKFDFLLTFIEISVLISNGENRIIALLQKKKSYFLSFTSHGMFDIAN